MFLADAGLSLDLPKRLLDILDRLAQLAEAAVWWDGFRTGAILSALVVLLWTHRKQ